MAISLRKDNPFITGYVIKYPQGDQSLERFPIEYQASTGDKLHVVKNYDTLWNIAYDYYGNSKEWWIIADVNKIENPYELVTNSTIIIPDLNRINILSR